MFKMSENFNFTTKDKEKFENDGYLVVENFLTEDECDSLRQESLRLIEEMNPKEHKSVFGDHEQMKSNYLIQTSDKIGFFWQSEAFDKSGNLKFSKVESLNKIGHALHALSPPFNQVTFSKKVETVLKKLSFIRPVIPQSMMIFKPPGIGKEVNRHIDATFLYSDPLKLIGFWIALEDATTENACLKFARGSHKTTEVSYRMVRNPIKDAAPLVFEGSFNPLPFSEFEAAPVKKGSLVLIDGKVQHCSDKNTSNKSRHIYTFHIVESYKSVWSEKNWLQPSEALPFPAVYDDSNVQ